MSTHACSTSPCPSCEPKDYQAARRIVEIDREGHEDARFLALKGAIMDCLSAVEAEILDASAHGYDTEHRRRLTNVEFCARGLLSKIEGRKEGA
jgi:hypothetical protein